ncbi:solute carrier family 35 (adenosine 3'-phospho 5'-phosphosulfate transporter), member B3 [Fistulifera solaris]|uniref:Solute carrier family 35 (Adenosine 3'-phospho 5'-phosphosulfate transporter), member B3 n=1 Tax=Fistulifera solaris TaxID=1519565 RepID=A0A1Z5JNN4_FISSO|nr:solute carrier family 35 (adenosine 3'-phospho 5'-phosphosulfate transporter), member B3 [Fistulifera solaris]|eukprot:GAX15368.1 solute carrier family 35 (adenosine 3'-phospho 5'-phosphosulfate transporter), member B3 [Fistulifera solaris]
MRNRHQLVSRGVDDADIAAGKLDIESAPDSLASINTNTGADLEFFEDLVSEPVLVLGVDISHLPRQTQFIVCAMGVFGFSLLYGYLQELIAVQICNRNLGLFQAMAQFSGYTGWAYLLRNFVYRKQQRQMKISRSRTTSPTEDGEISWQTTRSPTAASKPDVPMPLYVGLSLLRALDLGMTNLAMQYINYPAKTLMKSSRVVFTMIFGVIISRKTYYPADYAIVMAMVAGLAIFMHADSNSSAVFHHIGVVMLTVSLICDGAISNLSERIMVNFGVGQDEFIFRLYSIALVAITVAAALKGDLREGLVWLATPGTYDEVMAGTPLKERSWSVPAKILVMVTFSSMGFFGSSCSAAITKNFGALAMSITSTARKAMTLFISFFVFNNVCTPEHVGGVAIFISALTAKSLRRGRAKSTMKRKKSTQFRRSARRAEMELRQPKSREASLDSMSSLRNRERGTNLTESSPSRVHVV